ncbi:MAG: hypothetical protein R3C11_20465 [Planctomycetaceae bacterium]
MTSVRADHNAGYRSDWNSTPETGSKSGYINKPNESELGPFMRHRAFNLVQIKTVPNTICMGGSTGGAEWELCHGRNCGDLLT